MFIRQKRSILIEMSRLEWAESQLAEIDLLSSMFPNQDEFEITDQLALAELRNFVEGATDMPTSSRPQFLIKQKVDTSTVERLAVALSCAYPLKYPSILPEITVRCVHLNRAEQTHLQTDLITHLMATCQGEICVTSAVEWVKDNVHLYINKSLAAAPVDQKEYTDLQPLGMFSRLWIYSHHIYNKTKRKNILEWSKELGLSGFSMPGKPGVVCVEGPQFACGEFWSRLRDLTWKKIMIRHREDIPMDSRTNENIDSLRKFSGFEEAMFDPHGNRGNHMDLGQLYQFLNERGCCDVFQMYFGIEGR